MSPPSYADLGKSARDVFGKGFHFGQVRIEQIHKNILILMKNISGQVKLEVKHKCPGSGAEVTGGGVSNIDSGKVTAAVDIKSKRCPGTGTQLTSKWTTDNVLNTSLDIQVRLKPSKY